MGIIDEHFDVWTNDSSGQFIARPEFTLIDTERHWKTLKDTERHWKTLKDADRHWQTTYGQMTVADNSMPGHCTDTLTYTERHWQTLTDNLWTNDISEQFIVRHSFTLTDTERHRETPTNTDRHWGTLTDIDRHWKTTLWTNDSSWQLIASPGFTLTDIRLQIWNLTKNTIHKNLFYSLSMFWILNISTCKHRYVVDPDIGSIFHFVKVTQFQGGSCVLKVRVKKRLAFSVQFFKKVPRPGTCVKVFSLCAKFSFLKWLACVETRLPSDKTLLESRTHNIWSGRSRQIRLGNIGNIGNIWSGRRGGNVVGNNLSLHLCWQQWQHLV